jgi:membrane dipeptidase
MSRPAPPIVVDGHTHIFNRVYWEGTDPWQPQPFGFDFARAFASGVNVIIENVAPYGYGNFGHAARQTLRLVETAHRYLERHADRMALALTGDDIRAITASGRLAVVLGVESGFDHDGDLDVLRAFRRLGVRVVQFATQTCFNAFADAEIDGPPAWHGINARGRALIAEMNELGVLIDITHATAQAQAQIIEASTAPVVASHVSLAAVSGTGLTDGNLRALAAKGGLAGIVGTSTALSARYREWMAAHPQTAAAAAAPVMSMVAYKSPQTAPAQDHGEFGTWFDQQMRARHKAAFRPWEEPAGAAPLVPTADVWADHVGHVLRTAGPGHAGIGLDLVGGRSCVPADAGEYPELLRALHRALTPEAAAQVAGLNWMRVLDDVLTG